MKNDTTKIGERLKKLRLDNNKTMDELGKVLHVTRQNISDMEKGKAEIHLDQLFTLANHFECNVAYLIGEIDTPKYETTDLIKLTGLNAKACDGLLRICREPETLCVLEQLLSLTRYRWLLHSIKKYQKYKKEQMDKKKEHWDRVKKFELQFPSDNDIDDETDWLFFDVPEDDVKLFTLKRLFIKLIDEL